MSKFIISTNTRADTRKGSWTAREEHDVSSFILEKLQNPPVRKDKNGDCFVAGELIGSDRKQEAIKNISILVYDVDGYQSLSEIEKLLEDAGIPAIVYSTHSHLKSSTLIKTDHFMSWAAKNDLPSAPTTKTLTRFLIEEKKQDFLTNIRFDSKSAQIIKHTSEGLFYEVTHDPVSKYRVVIPLKAPIEIASLSPITNRAIEVYRSIYKGIGDAIGIKYDHSCCDPSRVFYFPALREEGAAYEMTGTFIDESKIADEITFTRPYIDYNDYPRAQIIDKSKRVREDGSVRSLSPDDYRVSDKNGVAINLKSWLVNDEDFDIEECLLKTLPDEMIKEDRTAGGFHITCPFESNHSSTGGSGTFCANGSDTHRWTIHCLHNSCKSSNRDRLEYLRELIRQGFIVAEDLGILPPKLKPSREAIAEGLGVDVDTLPLDDVDSDNFGSELDALEDTAEEEDAILSPMEVYDTALSEIIRTDDINVARNQLGRMRAKGCEIDLNDVAEALSKSQLIGTAALAVLKSACRIEKTPSDTYTLLFKEKRAQRFPLNDAISSLRVLREAGGRLDFEQQRIADFYGLPLSEIRAQYSAYENGLIFQESGEVIARHFPELNNRYAKIHQGGDVMFLDMKRSRQEGRAVFVKARGLATLLRNRNEERIIKNKKGEDTIHRIYLFDEWMSKSTEIKELRGITFDPNAPPITKDNMFNLWDADNGHNGFNVSPKRGDCSVVTDHIFNVWCNGDRVIYNWVITWLAHLVQKPGEKPGSALLLIGTQGTGKTVIFEEFFGRILGKSYGYGSKREDIVGNWTDNMVGKLMFLAEETLFAGDKRSMDNIKDIITGKRANIKEKFVSSYEVPSFTRYAFTTNHLHAIHVENGDRRFCILETSAAHARDLDYFSPLYELAKGDGPSYLLEFLLSWKPENVGLTWESLRDAPDTEGKLDQIEMSEDLSDQFFLDILKYGRVSDGTPSSIFEKRVSWPLDKEYIVDTDVLISAYESYVRFHAGTGARFERPKFSKLFKKYLSDGKSISTFRKSLRDNFKTRHVYAFPPRNELLELAHSKKLITLKTKQECLVDKFSHLYDTNEED